MSESNDCDVVDKAEEDGAMFTTGQRTNRLTAEAILPFEKRTAIQECALVPPRSSVVGYKCCHMHTKYVSNPASQNRNHFKKNRFVCHRDTPTMSRRPQKDLRACLLCSIVLPLKEFVDTGCPNCQDLMSSAHDGTTSNWEGSIALINPNESWVSKWQGLTNYVQGLYAVRCVIRNALC
jgi:RNA polymerase subunit RPABC4/transcription elongation factor Spt4